MNRNGFTLLEVIVALALAALLFALIGMTVGIYLRLADAGRAEVEEAQLARALLQRMADDLRGAVGCPAGSTWGVGLVGNSSELQVDVSRLPRPAPLAAAAGADQSAANAERPSDLKTVAYYMLTPEAVAATGADRSQAYQGGLVRRELDRAAAAWASRQGQTAELDRAAEVLAPEVTSLEFAYYDGSTSCQEWDCRQQGRLPAAVKIAVAFRRAARNRGSSVTAIPEDEGQTVTYSLLVRLPGVQADSDQASSASADQSTAEPKEAKPVTPQP